METLEEERSAQKAKTLFPEEIIEEIFAILPVKSILRFRSVSKPFLSLISNPSFTKLHSTRTTRTALFISARDRSNGDRHLLSGSHEGGPATHLRRIDTPYSPEDTEAQHSNGLVCFTYGDLSYDNNITLVLNPSTHKFFILPRPLVSEDNFFMCNFFGFDESTNEHKILNLSQPFESDSSEIMLFSLSSYSLRKIDVDLHVNITGGRWYGSSGYVCVNSTIHIVLRNPLEILAFDLTTEKFSVVKIPRDFVPQDTSSPCIRFIKMNGLLGIVCHDRVEESNEMDIWILKDYGKRVWVRETIRFPECWRNMGRPFPLDSGNTDEIIFSPCVLSEDLIEVPIYDMKRKCFKSIQLTLDRQFVWGEAVMLEEIKCYVESLIPLKK